VQKSAAERARRLRNKADELRTLAEGMTSHHARMTLLCLAEDYDKLSRHADRTEGDAERRATA
jgi:hypothetical protein